MEAKESLEARILVEGIWKVLVMEKKIDGMLNYCAFMWYGCASTHLWMKTKFKLWLQKKRSNVYSIAI